MPPPVYFVQHLSGHDERLLGMHTRRIDLAHPAVTRIVAGLQPLDRIDLRTCLFDCHASLVLGLRHRIAEAEAAAQGWRLFDADGVLCCKRFPGGCAGDLSTGPSTAGRLGTRPAARHRPSRARQRRITSRRWSMNTRSLGAICSRAG